MARGKRRKRRVSNMARRRERIKIEVKRKER